MKTLTLLGSLFLPGTYLASFFDMGFFNFEAGELPPTPGSHICVSSLVPQRHPIWPALPDSRSAPKSNKSTLLHSNTTDKATDPSKIVSSWLWLYFALTVPLTCLIVGAWLLFDRRRLRRLREDQLAVEGDVEVMEREIMATIRRKTLRTESTWNSVGVKA